MLDDANLLFIPLTRSREILSIFSESSTVKNEDKILFSRKPARGKRAIKKMK